MALEEDLRHLADTRLEALNRREERHKTIRKLWEAAKQEVIRPTCETVQTVAGDYRYFAATFECNNGTCILSLESSKANPNKAELRFEPDFAKGRIEISSELSGKEYYDLDPLDFDAIEERVRSFFESFLNTIPID